MIYAVSDIHGDIDRFVSLLKTHKVVDSNLNWCAGTNTLVGCGDSTDRGKFGVEVVKLFYNLTKQAEQVGGKVIHLKGNHDALMCCMALSTQSKEINSGVLFDFQCNGGNDRDSNWFADPTNQIYLDYLIDTPAMCKINNILFQHVDGSRYYERLIKGQVFEDPDTRIANINKAFKDKSSSIEGCYELWCKLTNERYWNYLSIADIKAYLSRMGATQVVHGHTSHKKREPEIYASGLVINIDATMSYGYRSDYDRGLILELP